MDICPIHAEFRQTPDKHLQGKGCGQCARNIQLTTKEFVSRSRDIHGDKYDYSKTKYINNSTKVVIGCPIHGEFKQSPDKHLSGCGCIECGRITTGKKKASTQEEFLDKASDIHGDRYDYSKVEYTRSNRKVIIICPEHGEFQKTPNKHLSGEGCPKCSGRYRRTADDFIADAQKIHGKRYDYSKADYLNTKHKVTIICPEHGEFQQTPESHLLGAGCPKCAGTERLTTEEFIRRAKEVHGDTYDYSNVKYLNSTNKVMIILYYVRLDTRTHTLWKIGITNRTVEKRFLGSDLKMITPIKTWPYKRLADALEKEQEIIDQYIEHLYAGPDQPLATGGNTELFTRDVLGLDPEYK